MFSLNGIGFGTVPTDPIELIGSMQERVRVLRRQISKVEATYDLLHVLAKILSCACAMTKPLRCVATDSDVQSLYVECMEFIWNASKAAIVRWVDIKDDVDDIYLESIHHLYSTVPVFINWDLHLPMIERVFLLAQCAVEQHQQQLQALPTREL